MWLLELQTAQWLWVYPGHARVMAAAAVAILYVLFCFALRYRKQQYKQKHANAWKGRTTAETPMLVAFASQTGFAEELAWQTADALRTAGVPTNVESLDKIRRNHLSAASRALFVVSTTGEGDAPDSAAGFTRAVMTENQTLPALQFAVLALGDREYRNFCGFGRRLEGWLRERGAQPLFDAVEVDDGDEQALRRWRQHLTALTGSPAPMKWPAQEYDLWRLKDRQLANPTSAGQPTFYLALEPPTSIAPPTWQPGDIAEIRPHHPVEHIVRFLESAKLDGRETVSVSGRTLTLAEVLTRSVLPQNLTARTAQEIAENLVPLPKREFSIASVPADGAVELLVRQSRDAQGNLGLASGWLTEHAWIDARIEMRIRTNTRMHPPPSDAPLILIGNGTGMAGLRPYLKARTPTSHAPNWLIFGERNAAHDFYYRQELEQWRESGVLQRMDLAFSRDQERKVYVQDKVVAAAETLRQWVQDGAHILVCGSLEGMAPGVDAALKQVLGTAEVEHLIEAGRYRKDVY